ncbi:hypothetical protein BJX65DRAFT_315245 [Aspergillus insuetus]
MSHLLHHPPLTRYNGGQSPGSGRRSPAMLVDTLPWREPRPPVPAAVPPVAPLLSCPTRIGQAPEPLHCPREAALQAQLDLSIILLDHPLKRDLFQNTLVGLPTVLGVDAARQTLRDL